MNQITALLLNIFIIINIALLLSFFVVTKFLLAPNSNLKLSSKFKQYSVTFFGILFIIYLILTIILAFTGKFIFLIFLFVPFLIMKNAKCAKASFYSNIHILLFLSSLFLAFWLLHKIQY